MTFSIRRECQQTLEIIGGIPYLVTVGTGVEIAMGTYPVCNGIPYLYYRYSGKSGWELLQESAIPKELDKANLKYGYEDRNKGTHISHAEITRYNQYREKDLFSWFAVNLPKDFHEWNFDGKWNFAVSQQRMYKGKDGCKDIKPRDDPEMDESRKNSQMLEDSAKTVIAAFVGIQETAGAFDNEPYEPREGDWRGIASLKQSCDGIVENVGSPRDLKGSYARQITFSNGKRAQFNTNHWLAMTTCSKDLVYAIRRKDHTNFIINRFRATGEVVDVTKVTMEQHKMPDTKQWPNLFRVNPVTNNELIFDFAQPDSYDASDDPPPVHRITIWKARFNVKLPSP